MRGADPSQPLDREKADNHLPFQVDMMGMEAADGMEYMPTC